MQHVRHAANVWLPVRAIVQEAIDKRFEVNRTKVLCFVISDTITIKIPTHSIYVYL